MILPTRYNEFLNVFLRKDVNILPLYRLYNYIIKFKEGL